MVSRREVIAGGGLAGLGVGVLGSSARAGIAPPTGSRPALFVYDRLVPHVDRLIAPLAGEGVAVAAMSGDPGTLWLRDLWPLWQAGARPVAGITFGGALFCLEQLARTSGLVCTLRSLSLPAALPLALSAAGAGRAMAGEVPADRPVVWRLDPATGGGR